MSWELYGKGVRSILDLKIYYYRITPLNSSRFFTSYAKNPRGSRTCAATFSAIHWCSLVPGWKSSSQTQPVSSAPMHELFVAPILDGSSKAELKIGCVSTSNDLISGCESLNSAYLRDKQALSVSKVCRSITFCSPVLLTWGVRSYAIQYYRQLQPEGRLARRRVTYGAHWGVQDFSHQNYTGHPILPYIDQQRLPLCRRHCFGSNCGEHHWSQSTPRIGYSFP
jgi:hypothetical protein